jgi:hypothetical protein
MSQATVTLQKPILESPRSHKTRQMRFLTTLTLLAGLASAQTASFVPFGTACSFNGQTPAIGNSGLPQLGQVCTITYTGPNTNGGLATQQIMMPEIALAFGQLNTPIPTSLLPQQPSGCQGYINPLIVIPMGPRIGIPIFQDTFDLAIPNSPTLLGLQVYAQWLTTIQQCGFAGCNLIAVVTSDAATLTIGL